MSTDLSAHEIVIVTPIHEDAAASQQLFHELRKLYSDKAFVVAIDDGSVKEPVTTAHLEQAGVRGTVITLSRNVGHQLNLSIPSAVCKISS